MPFSAGQRARQIFRVFFKQVFVAVEHLNAIDHGDFAPLEKRLMGGNGGAIDIVRCGIRNAGDDAAGRGIGDVVHRANAGQLPFPVHEEPQGFDGCFGQ